MAQLEERFFSLARAAFGQQRWDAAEAEGSRLNLQQAIALALSPDHSHSSGCLLLWAKLSCLEGRPRRLPGRGPARRKPTNRLCAHKKDLQIQASRKRLKGFEPSTFCMASRRSSQLSYSREGAEYSRGSGAFRGGRALV